MSDIRTTSAPYASVPNHRARRYETVGTVRVVDPSRLNWLWITYNTVEELVRVGRDGAAEPAAMSGYCWVDDRTLEIDVREDNRFADDTPLDVAAVKRSFDELMRWEYLHPPGTQFNYARGTTLEIVDERQVRIVFPEPDGLAVGKLRAMHVMSHAFWDGPGFGYQRNGTGDGRW